MSHFRIVQGFILLQTPLDDSHSVKEFPNRCKGRENYAPLPSSNMMADTEVSLPVQQVVFSQNNF